MLRVSISRGLALLFTAVSLLLSGCGLLFQPVTTSQPAPTPVVKEVVGGVEHPEVFVEPQAFQTALLKAIALRDAEKLRLWMTAPFLTGVWREKMVDMLPADALEDLFNNQLAEESALIVVDGGKRINQPAEKGELMVGDVALIDLMGGKDPLSIPRMEAGVEGVWLVMGWGRNGRDDALLFFSRQTDNSLKWHGWMVFKGGINGTRTNGVQPYANDYLGFRLYAPKTFSVNAAEDSVSINGPLMPAGGHPGNVSIQVKAAMGSTAEQAVQFIIEDNKAALGPNWKVPLPALLEIDGEPAYVVDGIPAQDWSRRLYVVHDDLLYEMIFMPSDPMMGEAYWQMEEIYALVVNTFTFTR